MSVLFQLKNLFQEVDAIGSGAIFNAVKRSDVEGIQMVWPIDRVRSEFEGSVVPIFDLIRNLTRANTNLWSTRDLLLPRLISGEIDVSDLDIDTGVSAA